ncbi:MAG: class I SAM-dependent methyltransferase [Bacteroidales bacterium]|nr:class I SAM-dependent methyltransferase [Bacteroidales bacterium]
MKIRKIHKVFPGSVNYWEERYAKGGTSGAGSYNRLAEFKAGVINSFILDHHIQTVLELGCGDGNQLLYAHYPKYIGLDVSVYAIRKCISLFKNDFTKSFYLYDSLAFMDNHKLFACDLTLSLDVIFHLIEDEIFDSYMNHLFDHSNHYVIIYSSNCDTPQTFHERDRKFSDWVEKNKKEWILIKMIENAYKNDQRDPMNASKSDFYIYEKK